MYVRKKTYSNVYSKSTQKNLKKETTQLSIDWWMDKAQDISTKQNK